MKNHKLLLAVILLATVAATPFPHVYSSTLTITVSTDKPYYLVDETITVSGNLTYNDSPVQDWPVALEVQDPYRAPVVARTLQTDTNGTYSLPFKLPTEAKLGTYTIYVSSSYKGETATNNTTFELIPLRDIAVTNITLSKTVVGQGYSTSINVTITNQGELTETFNVSVFYDEIAITLPDGKNHTTTTLTSGNSITITLTWNTTGVAKGNYTISANATIVPGETDTTDNTQTDGTITVVHPGDLNNDRVVDIADVVLVTAMYRSKCGDPDYRPNSDIIEDCVIDIADVVSVTAHYRETSP